jgi:hypothetical protein
VIIVREKLPMLRTQSWTAKVLLSGTACSAGMNSDQMAVMPKFQPDEHVNHSPTCVSLLFLRGAENKIISEAMGYAPAAFTMDVYSHIIEGMQSDAKALLNDVLSEGRKDVSKIITPI